MQSLYEQRFISWRRRLQLLSATHSGLGDPRYGQAYLPGAEQKWYLCLPMQEMQETGVKSLHGKDSLE